MHANVAHLKHKVYTYIVPAHKPINTADTLSLLAVGAFLLLYPLVKILYTFITNQQQLACPKNLFISAKAPISLVGQLVGLAF